MRYTMLLWPHANARYQIQSLKLAEAELRLILARIAPDARVLPGALDMPSLDIECAAPAQPRAIDALCRHSLMYGLFERRDDGLLAPVAGRSGVRLGEDLPAVLKYKGKTNEMFLQLLINAALYSGDYWREEEDRLAFLDPMCGRATALFVAANRGWDAVGADVDRGDLKEAEKYFKRYLEFHRVKHALTRASHTLKGGGAAPSVRFEYAPDPQDYKAGKTRALELVGLDAARVDSAFGRDAFHIVACDLPYGVRHDAQLDRAADHRGNWLETLLASALPAWRAALKPGGAVAVSFNAQNFRPERLRALMADAGLTVMEGGPYEDFSHWVEQAITRDIAVGVKPR